MIRRIALTLLLLLSLTPLAWPQGVLIGPQGGFQKPGDGDDTRYNVGAFLRVKPSQYWGIDASGDYFKQTFLDGDIRANSVPVMASLRIYPFPYMYLAGGGVYQHLNLNFSPALNTAGINDTTKNRWGFQAGTGLEIPLTSWVALQADARYVWIDYDLDNVPGASNLTTDYYIVRFGLGFGFDWDWWTSR